MLDLSSLLFPLFSGGCNKSFIFTHFSAGNKHWISCSLQPFPGKEPNCLRLVKAPALGLDFTCSGMRRRAIMGIVKTVGRELVHTEVPWKMHSYAGHIYMGGCICMSMYGSMSSFPLGIHWPMVVSSDLWSVSSWRDCSVVAGPLLWYHALPLLRLEAPSEVSQKLFENYSFQEAELILLLCSSVLELLANPCSSVATTGK